MIDAKNAVTFAKQRAAELLDKPALALEEIERESYKDRDVWSITLSFPRDMDQMPPFARLGSNLIQYRRVLIDANSGELVAIKLREVASK
jgi:hypothetical protein